jgi:CheY-like chemotaxis protein
MYHIFETHDALYHHKKIQKFYPTYFIEEIQNRISSLLVGIEILDGSKIVKKLISICTIILLQCRVYNYLILDVTRTHTPVPISIETIVDKYLSMVRNYAEGMKQVEFHRYIDPKLPRYVYTYEETLKDTILILLLNAIEYSTGEHIEFSMKIHSVSTKGYGEIIFTVSNTCASSSKEMENPFEIVERGEKKVSSNLFYLKKRIELIDGKIKYHVENENVCTFEAILPFSLYTETIVEEIEISLHQDFFKYLIVRLEDKNAMKYTLSCGILGSLGITVNSHSYHISLPENFIDENHTSLQEKIWKKVNEIGLNSIVVVDDDKISLKMMTRNLTQQGFHVYDFASSSEALDAIRKGLKYMCLISDLCMPEITGIDLIEEVHELNPTKYIAIVTGFIDEQFTNNYADEIILKPITIPKMEHLVSRALEKNCINSEITPTRN